MLGFASSCSCPRTRIYISNLYCTTEWILQITKPTLRFTFQRQGMASLLAGKPKTHQKLVDPKKSARSLQRPCTCRCFSSPAHETNGPDHRSQVWICAFNLLSCTPIPNRSCYNQLAFVADMAKRCEMKDPNKYRRAFNTVCMMTFPFLLLFGYDLWLPTFSSSTNSIIESSPPQRRKAATLDPVHGRHPCVLHDNSIPHIQTMKRITSCIVLICIDPFQSKLGNKHKLGNSALAPKATWPPVGPSSPALILIHGFKNLGTQEEFLL